MKIYMKPPIQKVTSSIITIFLNFNEREKLHTNPALMRLNDEWIILMRHKMGVSNLLISRLNDDFIVKEMKWFDTKPFQDKYEWGAEDPRLFWHNDKLHFIYHGTRNNSIRTIIGEVNEHLSPEPAQTEISYDPGPEKNWTFFSYAGEQYAVNSFAPKFKVVKITNGIATNYSVSNNPAFPWKYGEARGGTPAIRVGEHFYTVFQSHVIQNNWPRYYCAAFAKFSAKPPFNVKAITGPVLLPDEYRDWGYSVVFPAGLQLHDGKWFISYGHMDNECRIGIFDFDKVEGLFHKV